MGLFNLLGVNEEIILTGCTLEKIPRDVAVYLLQNSLRWEPDELELSLRVTKRTMEYQALELSFLSPG